jgi:hypothetical protein
MAQLKLLETEPDEASTELIGRDEMNLAEFPITLLSDRPARDQKTLCYEDAQGKLLITGSDAYGLPTAADADVIVALMQLTKTKNNFTDASVSFSRYELLKILNWPDTGKFYKRLAESLYRWSTTSLHYQGTWRDNNKKKNVNVIMHILESVVFVERGDDDESQPSPPFSEFTWNKIFLESCQANNLKNLDLGLYFSLEHPSSKRLFRFLDKRFYRGKNAWTFDLREIAFERVGLSRNYDGNAAKIREKLQPAIEELEQIGFLEPMTKEQRYEKKGRSWTIRLVKKGSLITLPADPPAAVIDPDTPPLSSLEQELVRRGVGSAKAATLAQQYPAELIEGKLDVFDWLEIHDDKRVAKSPAGYLVKSIEENYSAPKGFISKAERQRQQEAKDARERQAAEERRRKQAEEARERAEKNAVKAYWNALTADEQAELDAVVNARADPETLVLENGAWGQFGQTIRRHEYIRQLLRDRQEQPVKG